MEPGMMRVVEYSTAGGVDLKTLRACVNGFIALGWEPIGGMVFVPDAMLDEDEGGPGPVFLQAVVRREDGQ